MLAQSTVREFDLIAACCQGDSAREDIEAKIAAGVDWPRFIAVAEANKVASLVYETLRRLPVTALPEASRNDLKQRFDQNVRGSLALAAELVVLLRLLHEAEIPALPWKGPTLAKRAYGQVYLREFLDLDILVPESSWHAALALLQKRGYRLYRDIGRKLEDALSDPDRYCVLLYNEEVGVGVELHWRFAARSFRLGINYPQFWKETWRGEFCGAPARLARPEIELINLCAHGSRHYWKRLSWIGDVHFCVKSSQSMDWDYAFDEAKVLGCGRMFCLGILLSQLVLATPLPQFVMDRASEDAGAMATAAKIHNRLRRGANILAKGASSDAFSFWNLRYMVAIRENPSDGFSQVSRMLRTYYMPNANDRAVIRLPKALQPLYFVVRPMRLAFAMAAKALRPAPRESLGPGENSVRPGNKARQPF